MAVFKCKMCGGALDLSAGTNVGTCPYCGSVMTFPRLDDDKRANLYDRADHFRRNNEYDKAAAIFDIILNEDRTDAEAYWSLVLCKYGVEYVEDPQTRKRVPTCNRTQLTPVSADADYKNALANADGSQRQIYEYEAAAIDRIQRDILQISQRETPYDVFICYKETGEDGRRTPDSVLAMDAYHQLTQEGFKVFCSRVSLEDKLGTEYEPYIFAALQSSKVMLAIGTKPEHFSAVWVKNEWGRYLALIKNGAKKTLIPAYRDMDPYGLPEEFSNLQAQDMGKLGFMQDLIRGIKKLTEADGAGEPAAVMQAAPQAASQAEPLIKRAFMCLEDSDWAKADLLLEQVLNLDPENAKAYVGKLMIDLKIPKEGQLGEGQAPLETSGNFKKALRFTDNEYRIFLESCNQIILDRINKRLKAEMDREMGRLENIYSSALALMSTAKYESGFLEAAKQFNSINGYKDSAILAKECRVKARRKEIIWYCTGGGLMLVLALLLYLLT